MERNGTSSPGVNVLQRGPQTGARSRNKVFEKPKDLKGTLLRLWVITRGQRGGILLIMALSLLGAGAAVLSPLLIGDAINAAAEGARGTTERIALLLLLVYFADALLSFLQQFFTASVVQKLIHRLRMQLFSAMKDLPLSFYDLRQHGELMSRLTNDADTVSSTLSESMTLLLGNVCSFFAILVVMLRLSVPLTGAALLCLVGATCMTVFITNHTRQLFRRRQQDLGALNGLVEENVTGLGIIREYGREEASLKEFSLRNKAYTDTSVQALVWSGYLMPFVNWVNNLSFLLIAVGGGLLAVKGVFSLGMLSAFLLYNRRFTRPFVEIAGIYNNFQTALAGAERIFEIVDEPPEEPDAPDALPIKEPRGEIVFSDVSFSYPTGAEVLHRICFEAKPGTRVAIVGPTGSGKTTLVNLLLRFYDVTEGQILLDGRDLRDYRRKDLRAIFGMVLQDTALFARSVAENIAFGRPEAARAQVMAAAKAAGCHEMIERLPQGYDTVLSDGGEELSRGERQLLTIARAILADAPVLILDEATSNVDTVTEQKIRSAILKACEGRTCFIIAHRLSTIRDADLILVLSEGRIIERGTHESLMAENGMYAELYKTQTAALVRSSAL